MTTTATANPPAPAVEGDRQSERPQTPRPSGWLTWLSVFIATVPITAAVIRALTTDWMPVGDNAYFTVRSRDVLTEHHPLLGAWSAGSHAIDVNVNNLGSLQLILLAPFTKIAPVAGTAIGVGVVHVAAVLGIALTLRRLAGPVVVILGMAVTTGIAWTLGSVMLVETRQHHYLVLPFLCFLVLVWAVSAGGGWAAPWTAFVSSLLMQTHLTYAYLVAGLALWALVGFAAHTRAVRADPERWPPHRRRVLRQGALTLVVVLACWIQPLIDQFFGTGNMGTVLGAPGSGDGLGWGRAARLVATVVAVPPWWGRPSFQDFDPQAGLATGTSAGLGFAVVGVLLLAAGWLAGRARSRVGLMGVGTAVVAVVLAVVSAAVIPVGTVGPFAQVGNYRWLWPIGAFALLSIVSGVVLGMKPAGAIARISTHLRLLPPLAVAATAVLAVLNIPAAYHATAAERDLEQATRRMPIVADLIDQLDDLDEALDGDGPVFYDREDGFFGEPYSYAVLFRIDELGIEYTVDDDNVHRFGTKRRNNGQAAQTLKFVWGEAAREVPDGARRVAFVPGVDRAEQRELDSLTESIPSYLAEGRVDVDLAAARAASDRDSDLTYTAVARQIRGAEDVRVDDIAGELASLAEDGFLDHDGAFSDAVERWLELRHRSEFDTVGLLLMRSSQWREDARDFA